MIGLGLSITQLAVRQLVGQFNPMKLFALGEQGAWYDPSDFDRYMAPLGPELVVNGDFNDGTTGWFAYNVTSLIAESSGEIAFGTTLAGAGGAGQTLSLVVGRSYKLTGSVRRVSGDNVSLNIVNNEQTIFVAQSQAIVSTDFVEVSLVFTATQTNNKVYLRTFDGNTLSSGRADNISVRELTAIDTATLYQDAAGTTPVTAVEQPVGLMLDKSKGLVLGPELVSNGTFETNITGWVVGNAGQSTLALADGKLRITRVNAGDTYPNARTTLTGLTVGRIYKIVSATNNPFGIEAYHAIQGIALSTVRTTLAAKTMECVFTATATSHNLDVGIWGSSGSVGQYVEFDNISVRELPGNHASQTTATSRPVLSARYNLLTKTEQFDDAAWQKINSSVISNSIAAPDGTLTADKLVENTATQAHGIDAPSTTINSGTTYTASLYAKLGERRYLFVAMNYVRFVSGNGVCFDLQTGAIVATGTGSATAGTITPCGNGWYRCSVTLTAISSGTAAAQPAIYLSDDVSAAIRIYTGDGTSGIYIWGASLVPTNQADLPYQRVNTATDYDAGPAYPRYLRCDGIDDGMVTNSIDFTATDKMTVFAGVRKLSDSNRACVVEHNNLAVSPQGFFINAPLNAAQPRYTFASGGTSVANTDSPASYASPITNVVTGIGDISGDISTLRVNGTQAATSSADQGTGNYGNYPLFIGRRGGTTLPFNGHLYSLIVRGAQSTTAQIEATEAYVNGKTGAYE